MPVSSIVTCTAVVLNFGAASASLQVKASCCCPSFLLPLSFFIKASQKIRNLSCVLAYSPYMIYPYPIRKQKLSLELASSSRTHQGFNFLSPILEHHPPPLCKSIKPRNWISSRVSHLVSLSWRTHNSCSAMCFSFCV